MRFFRFLILSLVGLSTLRADLASHIKYNVDGPNPIGLIEIPKDRQIDQSTFLKVKYSLEDFKQRDVSFVLLKLNTPGGQVFPSMKIAKLLEEFDTKEGIPVVAYIDNWAISAGAMLAYSCRFIGITSTSSMGAAEPIMVQGKESKTASEKVNSALRSEFANHARYFDRDPLLAEAMVDKSMILVMRKGEIVQLEETSAIKKSDTVITREGKLLTLDSKELEEFGVADFKADDFWEYPFFKAIPNPELITYKNWKIDFFALLSHPLVAGLLMMGLMLGIYIEISSPGFGLPGILGLTCLAFILLGSFAAEAVNLLEVLLLAIGAILLLVELFVLPGFGIIGIIGVMLMVGGLFAMMLPNLDQVTFTLDPDKINLATQELLRRLAWLSISVLLSIVIIVVLAKFFSKRIFFSHPMILHGEQEHLDIELPAIGSEGESFTSLRPSGKISIQNKLFDGLSDGAFIEKGARVRIERHEGSHIVVSKIK